jgi:diguanylate cyclase (GGDEF)-like protein
MAELARLASSDSLTGLANRHTLRKRLAALIEEDARQPFALLYFDLDNFKNVNDSLGHGAGDELLRDVAARLRAATGSGDTLARLGGDEFAVICIRTLTPEAASHRAAAMLKAVRAPYTVEGRTLHVASSIGIAMFPQHGNTVDVLLRNADMALYSAKASGRNTWNFFHEDMSSKARLRLTMQSDLIRGLEQKQFEVHYQPQVDMASGVVRGFEALVRWRHPERGLIPPGQFIRLAEECGLIVPLGGFVLREACMTAARWPGNIRVAVNVSAAQFSRSNVLQEVTDALQASGLAPQRLEVEVTESVLIDDAAAALKTLIELRALGIGLALDDFGTGYSSLAYLRDYPLTKLKIDRSFVSMLGSDRSTVAIVRSIVQLADELRLDVVAEGIETKAEHETLFALGCRTGQGYMFSRPLAADDLARYISAMQSDLGSGDHDAAVA